jgi:hypothetical protein
MSGHLLNGTLDVREKCRIAQKDDRRAEEDPELLPE